MNVIHRLNNVMAYELLMKVVLERSYYSYITLEKKYTWRIMVPIYTIFRRIGFLTDIDTIDCQNQSSSEH